MLTNMWSVAFICLSLVSVGFVHSAPVVHVWNDREVLPIKELALIRKHEFPHKNFDPPLIVREDGALFLSVAMVDSEAWINLALNSFVTLAKHQNISGLTIMTTGDEKIGSVFRKLGLFTYDARATVATYPADFRLENPLPSWSWGAVIFLRYNAWFEAFRRGIGFILVDTDVTFNKDVFFARDKNGQFVDIAIQGDLEAINPKAGHHCQYKWSEKFDNRIGFYTNPGLSSHAYNERTLKFVQDFQSHLAITIKRQLQGWGQPAYLMHFCESNWQFNTSTPADDRWQWGGTLKQQNVSVSLFRALSPWDASDFDQKPVTAEDKPHIPAYHAKACHGANSGDALARVKCKEDWLKDHGQWFLPDDVPRGDGWFNIDDALVAKLRALLHGPK